MSEQYTFKDYKSWFDHYLLNATKSSIAKLTESPNFNPKDMTISLTINEVNIRIDDFNNLLDKWSDEVEASVKNKLDYMQTEKALNEKAWELLKTKANNLYSIIQAIDDMKWQLDVDD